MAPGATSTPLIRRLVPTAFSCPSQDDPEQQLTPTLSEIPQSGGPRTTPRPRRPLAGRVCRPTRHTTARSCTPGQIHPLSIMPSKTSAIFIALRKHADMLCKARMGPDIHPWESVGRSEPSRSNALLESGSVSTNHQHLLKHPGEVLVIKAKEPKDLRPK